MPGEVLIPGLDDLEQKAFFGIGYGDRIPLDVHPIFQLGSFIPNLGFLIVDEFLRLNGVSETAVEYGKTQLIDTFSKLSELYGFSVPFFNTSCFMHLDEYTDVFEDVRDRLLKRPDLSSRILETVPTSKQESDSAMEYPIHELACVKYLSDGGYGLKIGPSKEKAYDEVMRELRFPVNFSYILDAFALGSKTADEVVHYIPNSRGPNNGQRIFFGDSEEIVKQRLLQGCDEALKYFCKIASVSGYLLGKDYLSKEDIEDSYGKRFKKKTIRLVLENMIKPFEAVS